MIWQSLRRRWSATFHPERYHGWGRRAPFFEGWYLKVVAPGGRGALAFIPGIALDRSGDSHAFVQILDGLAVSSTYHRFATTDFRPRPDRFGLDLGRHYFGADGLSLALPQVSGTLSFRQPVRWPRRWYAPGVMGWYSFVPFMECYHGVVSMHHELEGHLSIGGKTIDFSGGSGYIEKDWGTSFPSSWIWLQSTHLERDTPTSLMVSIARIPWLGSHFIGFLGGLLLDGELHRFATYTGARARVRLSPTEVHLVITDQRRLLEITGPRRTAGGDLASPIAGQMTGKVNESLQAELRVRFTLDGRLRYDGIARFAGLEVGGNAEQELVG
jgi:hypothetical protein